MATRSMEASRRRLRVRANTAIQVAQSAQAESREIVARCEEMRMTLDSARRDRADPVSS